MKLNFDTKPTAQKLRLVLCSLGRRLQQGSFLLLGLGALALATGGCAGDYYQAGYGSAYYAPDYSPFYGEYGYYGAPYYGYDGFYGGPDIIVGTSHHRGYYGYHHFASEHGRTFSHGGAFHGSRGGLGTPHAPPPQHQH